MARESVVSREFKGTKVTFLAMNTSTCMPERVDYTFESRMTNDDEILKQLTKAYKKTDIVPAKVLEKEDFTKLLAMKTEDFMKYAFELDLETRKRLEPVNVESETQDNVTDETQDNVTDETQDNVTDETQDIVTDETQNIVTDETQDIVTDETQDTEDDKPKKNRKKNKK